MMAVQPSWKSEYEKLQRFIACEPQIRIERGNISIPTDIRDEFYRCIDAVRKAFIEEKYNLLPTEAGTLSNNYNEVERDVVKLLGLENITMVTALEFFLHDPKQGLMRSIYDPLFRMLQKEIEFETFEKEVLEKLDADVKVFCALGYEMWLALCLVKWLEPEKCFKTNISSSIIKAEDELSLEESNNIIFGQSPSYKCFILPDFVVHSTKINKYVGIKSELSEAVISGYGCKGPSRLLQFRYHTNFWGLGLKHHTLLIYLFEQPEEISIVANINTGIVNKPDLVIECIDQDSFDNTYAMNQLKLRHEILRPKLGTYIVSREPLPAQYPQAAAHGIRHMTVGFEQSKLQSVFDILIQEFKCKT